MRHGLPQFDPLALHPTIEAAYSCVWPPVRGVQPERSSKWLFHWGYAIRAFVGDPYGRDAGELVLWESVETPAGVAKIVPLRERLSGMCGSVGHGEGLALYRGRARLCSPSGMSQELGQGYVIEG